jgi:vacuolar-type H+-ATPase subunit H
MSDADDNDYLRDVKREEKSRGKRRVDVAEEKKRRQLENASNRHTCDEQTL